MILGFVESDACILAVQAGMVLAPRRADAAWIRRLESRWWALVPLASIVVVILAIQQASQTASGLTWLALVAVPILAAVALGWASHGARWWLAPLAAPLLAVAWAWPHRIEGQITATLLTAFSCVTLGVLLATVCPPGWLKIGIILMAAGDSYLVLTDLLQAPNSQLVAAVPHVGGLHLPQLQGVTFQDVLMGYGDLFIAAVLGGVIARGGRARWGRWGQARMALLTGLLAGAFDLLFFVLDELPATVPVALAVIVAETWRWAARRRATARSDAGADAAGGGAQWGSSPVAAGGRDSSASDVMASVPRAACSSTSVASSADRE